jgi:hypothetical protein
MILYIGTVKLEELVVDMQEMEKYYSGHWNNSHEFSPSTSHSGSFAFHGLLKDVFISGRTQFPKWGSQQLW